MVDMDFIMPFILLNDDGTDDENKLLTMILLSSLSGGLDMPNGEKIFRNEIIWFYVSSVQREFQLTDALCIKQLWWLDW